MVHSAEQNQRVGKLRSGALALRPSTQFGDLVGQFIGAVQPQPRLQQ
jgi:hypothetical protein